MRTGHLFAGGGGGLYADLILGHTPVFAVEWDPYACAVLRSRAADGWFPGLRVHEGDVRLFDPSEYAGRVDCLHAGFPCQDISTAGGGAGIHGERSGLYREVLRIADAIRPQYIFLENVAALTSRGLGTVLGDLAKRGYNARWTCLSAAQVGAPHKRDRWWCLATYPNAQERGRGARGAGGPPSGASGESEPQRALPEHAMAYANEIGWNWGAGVLRKGRRSESSDRREDVAIPGGQGLEEREGAAGEWAHPAASGSGWWSTEPAVGRLADGVAHRSHQIRALGNGQVPLCAAVAFSLLWDREAVG